jgi:hypothetical protein
MVGQDRIADLVVLVSKPVLVWPGDHAYWLLVNGTNILFPAMSYDPPSGN